MTPETELGQGLTVIYAIVGLPISMMALKTIGDVIVNGIRSLVLKIERRFFKRRGVHRIKTKTFVGTCLLMIVFILLGTIMEVLAEGWSFVQGVYVWFVTFSTIGFGDYVPFQGLEQKAEYRNNGIWVFLFGLAFFMMAGLCVVSAVLTSLVQAAEELREKSTVNARFKKNMILRYAKYTFNQGDRHKGRSNVFVLSGRIIPRNGAVRPRTRSLSF